MHIICLTPLAPGVYNDHSAEHITSPPEGWAVILTENDPVPLEWAGKDIDYSLPSTFPRLGALEAEELTYTREVEVEKEVTKTRPVQSTDKDGYPAYDTEGLPIMITEEYTEMETVTEIHEYKMMTVVSMTEGTLPEVVEEEPEPTVDELINALLGVSE